MAMKLRTTQLAVFQVDADADFIARVADYITRKYGDAIVDFPGYACLVSELPPSVLLAIVADSVAQGRAYRMTWESTLAGFTSLRFLVAPNFASHPLVWPILTDDEVPPDSRLDELARCLDDDDWEAVEDCYEAEAWNAALLAERAGIAFPPHIEPSSIQIPPGCLECGADLSIADSIAAGARTCCEHCGTIFRVVAVDPLDLEYLEEEPAPPRENEEVAGLEAEDAFDAAEIEDEEDEDGIDEAPDEDLEDIDEELQGEDHAEIADED
ncbi:MAG TPA: hypothetical protein VGB85_17020 [Nannocystis sp.]